MPRMRLWDPYRGTNFDFFDRKVREIFDLGGTGVYIHKYLGPKSAGDDEVGELVIDDVLFMENRSRKYDDTIYRMYGHYNPENADFDLTQFGLFLSNDVIFIEFHINTMLDNVGRKLMSGDVLELPHLREFFGLDPDQPAVNKFFVVEDANRAAGGFDANWWPHIWRVKARVMVASEEYEDIIGGKGEKITTDADGNITSRTAPDAGHGGGDGDENLMDILSSYDKNQAITDCLVCEAEQDIIHDPTHFEGYHYYVYNDEHGIPLIYWGTGDGVPPNGELLKGEGDEFPDDMEEGDYFLRTDYEPAALYTFKDGCKFIRVEVDMRRAWTAQNQLIDSFIDNDNITHHDDCDTEPERQSLSKAVLPKADLVEGEIEPVPEPEPGPVDTIIFTPDFGSEFE